MSSVAASSSSSSTSDSPPAVNLVNVGFEENPIKKWMHDHPDTIQEANVALLKLGMYACVRCVKHCLSKKEVSKSRIIAEGVTGVLSLIVAATAYRILPIFCPPSHDVARHVYMPAQCEGGELQYEGDIPVLTITTDDPFQAGFAHGFLLASQICTITSVSRFAFHTLAGLPRPGDLPNTINVVKKLIPKRYRQELKGLVAGYNAKMAPPGAARAKPMTLEEAIFLHMLADKPHLDFREMENWTRREHPYWDGKRIVIDQPIACTVVVDGTPETGPCFGRNLDWPSLGVMGTLSILVKRIGLEGVKTVELAFPGLIGTMTGMNEHGFCLAMNVSKGSTSYLNGTPAALYNRMCLESCHSVSDAKKFVEQVNPLGPYHLSVADGEQAMTIHLLQDNGKHYFRDWNRKEPLVTTNFRYGPLGRTMPTMTNSAEREEMLRVYFASKEDATEEGPRESIQEALTQFHVNNIRTVHSVMMVPKSREMAISFDNGWAASKPLMPVNTQGWF